ncbi:hypothetical protein M433DRAFT_160358, partial [Acidomyces richmondensis BFW]
ISRQTTPAPNRAPPGSAHPSSAIASPGPTPAGFPAGFKLPHSCTPPGRGPSLAEKRGLNLGGLPGPPAASNPAVTAGRQKPRMTLSQLGAGQTNGEGAGTGNGGNGGAAGPPPSQPKEQSQMEKYAQFIDTKNGALTFAGKATVTGEGINFAGGKEFRISLDEVDTLDELGKGNYGTVYKVRHSRPKFRRQGQGLAGNKVLARSDEEPASPATPASGGGGGTSGIVMAMKEMRLELDDAKFASIIMELDILHRCCASPYIVDFYGAFFQEGAVYICMEWMDGGSMDKLYGHASADDEHGRGVPEGVLRKMTHATVLGLKSLKEEHNIIHRDVKPTNILANTRGQVKICDFGVSGNLVASIAKTNIGCQSYMAPERISSGGVAAAGMQSAGTYGVQSDVWSLGLTIIECGLGRYPYPPETYDNIFSQLSAIVDGQPPDLPAPAFSEAARDFVAGCLNKIPKLRPTYPMLLQHAWLAPLGKPATIVEEEEDELPPSSPAVGGVGSEGGNFVDEEVGRWVMAALERRKKGVAKVEAKPALHAAPLDAVPGSPIAETG